MYFFWWGMTQCFPFFISKSLDCSIFLNFFVDIKVFTMWFSQKSSLSLSTSYQKWFPKIRKKWRWKRTKQRSRRIIFLDCEELIRKAIFLFTFSKVSLLGDCELWISVCDDHRRHLTLAATGHMTLYEFWAQLSASKVKISRTQAKIVPKACWRIQERMNK